MVKGREVVMRDQYEGPLVETSLHRMVEFLAENTRPIEGVSTAVRGIWRTELDIWRIVGDSKVECQVFCRLRVLLLWKAVHHQDRSV